MDSYFLAETLKYLYLLFSPNHWLQFDASVLTTEAHFVPVEVAAAGEDYGAEGDGWERNSDVKSEFGSLMGEDLLLGGGWFPRLALSETQLCRGCCRVG